MKSERLKRAFLERARKGKDAWTMRMYGYQPDFRTLNPRQAAVSRRNLGDGPFDALVSALTAR